MTKIVYADYNRGGIRIVKADGTGRHWISTATVLDVAWSPNGK